MARQAILRRPVGPPVLQVALDESVLRRPAGGAEVMAAQLDQLAEVSELPNVVVAGGSVLGGPAPRHADGLVYLLRFPLNGSGEESEPPTVYAELYTGAVYLEKPSEIERYNGAFSSIWEQALDETSSRDLIRQAGEGLRNG